MAKRSLSEKIVSDSTVMDLVRRLKPAEIVHALKHDLGFADSDATRTAGMLIKHAHSPNVLPHRKMTTVRPEKTMSCSDPDAPVVTVVKVHNDDDWVPDDAKFRYQPSPYEDHNATLEKILNANTPK